MATVDALIGGLFGLLGFALIAVLAEYRALVNVVAALVLLVLGLALLRAIRIAVPVLRPAVRPAASFGSAYALGVPFGLSTCPVCTPMVLPVMAAAAATGTPLLGAGLLFTFGFARGVPLILLGMFAGMAQALRGAGQWVARIERAGGALLLLAAAYFLYQGGVYAGLLPALPFGGFES
jgi:cytochrome c-type biogenesis protein